MDGVALMRILASVLGPRALGLPLTSLLKELVQGWLPQEGWVPQEPS
jgi:hypothetical protein